MAAKEKLIVRKKSPIKNYNNTMAKLMCKTQAQPYKQKESNSKTKIV